MNFINRNTIPYKNKNITYNFLNLPETIAVTGKGTIVYTYDAAGNKLKKTTLDNTVTPAKTTVTDYLGPFIYQNDTLQFVVTEEGRARLKSPGTSDTVLYDYFEKDHLGNTRIVLTDQLQTDAYPPASLEQTSIANEKLFYSGLDNGIVNKNTVAAYPNDPYTNPNDFIQKLRGDNTKIGAGILLKVMSGDKLNVHASAWYKLNGATPDPPLSPLPDILFSLINGIPGISGNKLTAAQLGNGVLNPSVANFLNTRDATANTNRPRAWLNIIVFDEQMNIVITNDGKNSYFEQAGATNVLKVFNITNREITKNGYVYIYVSNETPNIDVFFDNLQATHIRGPLIEEEHYYGFGLGMSGINSRAANSLVNKKKFIGQLLDDDLELNWYQFRYRNHDPQIGRFLQIDPLSDKYVYNSTYAYAENKLGRGFDLEGLELAEFNKMFQAAGINVEQTNRKYQAVSKSLAKKAEPVINVSKDVITIAAGVTLLVGSGGTATPLLVGLAGSATVAGGSMKLAFDIAGNKEAADQIPTTLSGTAIFLTNGAAEAATGKRLISDDVKTVAEFSEGILTFKVTGFEKMKDVEKASTILSGLSLTLDGLNPKTVKAFQNLLGGETSGKISSLKLENKAIVDNTFVKPPVKIPSKKDENK